MADQTNDLKSRVEQAQKEINDVLKKYEISMTSSIEFPIYKQLPVDLQLAVAVINKHEPAFVPVFTDLKKNE